MSIRGGAREHRRLASLVVALFTLVGCGDEPQIGSDVVSSDDLPGMQSSTAIPTTAPSTAEGPATIVERVVTNLGDPLPVLTTGTNIYGTTAIDISDRGVIAVAATDESTMIRFFSPGRDLLDEAGPFDGLSVSDAAFVPGTDDLITAATDGTVQRWERGTGDEWSVAGTWQPHDGARVTAIAVSPDGSSLATGGVDGAVHVIDARTGASVEPPGGETTEVDGNVVSIAFVRQPEDEFQQLAVSTTAGSLYLVRPGTPSAAFSTGRRTAPRLAVGSTSHLAVIGGPAVEWIRTVGQQADALSCDFGFDGPATALDTFSVGGGSTLIAAAGPDPQLRAQDRIVLCSSSSSEPTAPSRPLDHRIIELAFGPDGQTIVAADDQTVVVLSVISE